MNKPKPVFLLAGGRRAARVSPDPLIQAVFRECGAASPVIAYVGTAHGDDRGFFSFMANFLLEAGAARVNHALISPEKADLKNAQEILGSADMVYVGGGDVEEGIRTLKKKNMADYLRSLYENGKPFFGVSAGAIMLAKKWVRWRDPDDDSTAELFPCLGFASIICDTHGEQEDWEELKVALKLANEGEKGYGIVSGTALKVYPTGEVQAMGGPIHQFVLQKGKVNRISDIQPTF
jgi:cyanophycinase-like exopeptidase